MSALDTSRIDAGRRESLEVAEDARQTEWEKPSFAAGLYGGRVLSSLIRPFPEQDPADKAEGDAFLKQVEAFLREHLDADAIDRDGDIPAHVLEGLVKLGCFGMKIPKEYGGLGFSQTNYNRVISLVSSHCGSTAVWLSAHQSIGAPKPLILFGTEEQKKKYLPRLSSGAISAFALTEPDVGSDPAKMSTTAVPTEDGAAYILNGEKLWCTNGPTADILVVMARLPSTMVDGRRRQQITAFIVERSMPGVEVIHRCRFMGLNGIQNGLLRFKDVRVPKDNILWGPGKGLKLALMTLNTGRITLPAACTGIAKQCLSIARQWSRSRHQWGAAIGKHEAIADKLGDMAAMVFAMDSVVAASSVWLDQHRIDGRLEAALAKLFCSEASWKIADQCLQIRGGRGYETADSLRGRGEPGIPVERIMRDSRINLIIEGTSEIMRLFIAREALDMHMRAAGDALNSRHGAGKRALGLLKAAAFYASWYPRQWCYWNEWPRYAWLPGPLADHMRYVDHASHRLARSIFHASMRHQIALERKQSLLGRLVDIGMYLFVMSVTCSNAARLARANPADRSSMLLADIFCRQAYRAVETWFATLYQNDDRLKRAAAEAVLGDKLLWLESDILSQEWIAS